MPIYLEANPHSSFLVFICLLMFCLVESFRYGYYFLKQNSIELKLFGLIRYNSFIVCYPLGAASECLVLYFTAKKLGDHYSLKMPNAWNFAFDMPLFMFALIPVYGAVFPQIYGYLMKQRRHYLHSLREAK